MNRNIGGYTIVEVMIFLAISMVLFASAVIAINGVQARTEFNTGMREIESKTNTVITEVVAGFTGSSAGSTDAASDFACTSPGPDFKPLLQGVAGANKARGANPECIFVGKAIQFSTASGKNDQMTIYPVLGRRTYVEPVTNDQKLVGSLTEANIAPAVNLTPPDNIDLASTYILPNGIEILSVKNFDSAGNPMANSSGLTGFFLSFNTQANTSRNGSEALNLYSFPLDPSVPPKGAQDSEVYECLRLNNPCKATPPTADLLVDWPLNQWQICFTSTKNRNRAIMTITSNKGRGASVKVDYTQCT